MDYIRRHPVALAALVIPLLIAVAVVGVLGMWRAVHPRYFLLALPLGYLVGTRGLVMIARAILTRVHRSGEAMVRVQGVLAVLMVILAAFPLTRYYAIPKQDYRFISVRRDLDVTAEFRA